MRQALREREVKLSNRLTLSEPTRGDEKEAEQTWRELSNTAI